MRAINNLTKLLAVMAQRLDSEHPLKGWYLLQLVVTKNEASFRARVRQMLRDPSVTRPGSWRGMLEQCTDREFCVLTLEAGDKDRISARMVALMLEHQPLFSGQERAFQTDPEDQV